MDIRYISACLLATVVLYQHQPVCGYDMIQTKPIPRGGRWRVNATAPRDYNDDQMNCGGVSTQWVKNNGSCGPCGDDASLSSPRPHENHGIFSDIGFRTIYRQFSTARIELFVPSEYLNANISFDLCHLGTNADAIETEECFERNKLEITTAPNGPFAAVGSQNTRGRHVFYVKIPFVKMSHGVLRTTATTAKSIGTCPDGQLGSGCSDKKELFRICSNIEIRSFFIISIPNYEGTFSDQM